jgi:hypothetical protein
VPGTILLLRARQRPTGVDCLALRSLDTLVFETVNFEQALAGFVRPNHHGVRLSQHTTTMKLHASLALVIAASTSSLAFAQDLFAVRYAPARIERYSAQDGTLLDPVFVDINGLVGLGGASQNVWDFIFAPNGEIWVSNYSAQAVYRFSADGTAYLGNLPVTVGLAVGIATQGSSFWVANVGGGVPGGAYEFDLPAYTQANFVAGTNIWDVHDFEGDVLLCRSNGMVERVDSTTGAVTLFASPGGFCEQAFTRSNGGLLIANFSQTGYSVHDASGALVTSYNALGAGNIRGVAELANGRVLINGTSGVYVHDPVAGGVTQLSAGAGAFIGVRRGGFVSTSTCSSNPNSTGNVADLSGTGSNSIASNDVRLTATSMPLNAFGFFLTSRTPGSVANPGGSQGVLCLGGSIGRFVGPGQIMNSGAAGSIALQINLTSMPQPTGPVPVVAGETWHFQAWFRDAVGGSATSNFTNGMTAVFQ